MGIINNLKYWLKLDLSCADVDRFLLAYLEVEGQLEDDTRLRFERHLKICPNCVRYLNQYKETLALLQTQPPPNPPDELVEETLAFLKKAL